MGLEGKRTLKIVTPQQVASTEAEMQCSMALYYFQRHIPGPDHAILLDVPSHKAYCCFDVSLVLKLKVE